MLTTLQTPSGPSHSRPHTCTHIILAPTNPQSTHTKLAGIGRSSLVPAADSVSCHRAAHSSLNTALTTQDATKSSSHHTLAAAAAARDHSASTTKHSCWNSCYSLLPMLKAWLATANKAKPCRPCSLCKQLLLLLAPIRSHVLPQLEGVHSDNLYVAIAAWQAVQLPGRSYHLIQDSTAVWPVAQLPGTTHQQDVHQHSWMAGSTVAGQNTPTVCIPAQLPGNTHLQDVHQHSCMARQNTACP